MAQKTCSLPDSPSSLKSKHIFLQGGGEMGALTRAFDWSGSSLGSPDTWPQSLRTIISVVLTSRFPMFIWWGEDLVQFYNDAYRPSFGENGKHPAALGQKAKDCWPEIWLTIKPLIDQVMNEGEAIFSENQLIPIYRNGKLEDVYWTFSYSPLPGDAGLPASVLVTCVETTETVLARKKLQESESRYRTLAEESLVANALFKGPEIRIDYANSTMIRYWGKDSSVIGKTLREALPELEGQPFHDLLDAVYDTGITYEGIEAKTSIQVDGTLQDFYFNFSYKALHNAQGSVYGILLTAIDVTEMVRSRKVSEASEEQFRIFSDNLQNLAWIADGDGWIFWYNQRWYDYTGTTLDEMQGWSWQSVHHPEHIERVLAFWKIAFLCNEPAEMTFPLRGKDGAFRWYLTRAVPVFDEQGKRHRWIGTNTDVHEQVLAEQALRESEQRFRAIGDQSPMMVYILESDMEAPVSYWNKAWLDYTGQTFDEAIGRAWDGIVHPDDVPGVLDVYVNAFQNREPYTLPAIRLKRYDGSYRWHLFKASPRYAINGDFMGFVGVGINVDDQQLAEERLQESEQRLRTLVMQADVATAVLTGRDMVLELANDPMLHIWDRDESVIGMRLLDFLPELADQPFPRLLDKVFSTGETHREEDALVLLKRKGRLEKVYMDFSYKAMRSNDGQITGILVNATDSTERVLAKERLILDADNLRNTILKAPVAMCIFKGPQYVIEIANERMFEFWGKTGPEVMNKPLFEALPDAADQGFEPLMEEVYATGNAYSASDVPVTLHRNGRLETVYINFVYEAFRETNTAITGIIAVAVDVTAQVIARHKIEEVVKIRTEELAIRNEELAESNRQLMHSNDELSQYAYVASHDLQEPLRKIRTFSSMLTDEQRGYEKNKLLLAKISHSAERMTSLIQGLLNFSRLLKSDEGFDAIDLKEIVATVVIDYELAISEKGASVNIGELPIIEASPIQMNQLFYNLLGNALKFCKPDVVPEIFVESSPISTEEAAKHIRKPFPGVQYHRILIIDNGIGFEPEYADQIFEVFKRLHTRDIYPGSGIGLALCRRIVVNHGGALYAESVLGSGTRFHIILPEASLAKHLPA